MSGECNSLEKFTVFHIDMASRDVLLSVEKDSQTFILTPNNGSFEGKNGSKRKDTHKSIESIHATQGDLKPTT